MNNVQTNNAFYAALRNRFKTLFNRYKVNTLADGGTVRSDTITSGYMKFCQNNRLSESIKFAWLGEAGIKTRTSGANQYVVNAYGLPNKNEYGSELITNQADRDLSSNTGFYRGDGGITIANGKATYSGGWVQGLWHIGGTEAGRLYKCTFEILTYISGSVNVGSSGGPTISSVGIKNVYYVSTNNYIQIYGSNFVGTITNVSIKEVLSEVATRSTQANQPFLGGNIAPNERYCLKNPNGGVGYMTHPAISFGATDAWSVTTVFNFNGSSELFNTIFSSSSLGCFRIEPYNNNRLKFVSQSATLQALLNVKTDIGKTAILTLSYNNNNINVYYNGIYKESIAMNENYIFNLLMTDKETLTRSHKGKIHAHIIRSQALTPTEVAAEYNLLRSYIPEIESVVIGTQTWATSNYEAVCTPQGNLIPEVQSNATWATSQTLYDTAYAATSGTVEQKTYAAVKAAAMWCHYNNDPAIGAIYGKLYNWFAVKLLQMDIDYYNTANPTALWGWRVPTQADFTTLSTYLGGDSVSGGKLKLAGTTYWNSPNTGADNSSGFSFLPNGYVTGNILYSGYLHSITESVNNNYALEINYNSSALNLSQYVKIQGFAIRLIKS